VLLRMGEPLPVTVPAADEPEAVDG
jgi:hypothetical protein